MDLEAARGSSCIKVEKKGRGRNGEGEGVSGWARAKREGRGGVRSDVHARVRGLIAGSCTRAAEVGNDMTVTRQGRRCL
jgi:hypothetical protein